MTNAHLRLSDCSSRRNALHSVAATTVPVSLTDIVPLLLDAALTNRVWLEDFADETMEISQDLYEVLLAYRSIAQKSRIAA